MWKPLSVGVEDGVLSRTKISTDASIATAKCIDKYIALRTKQAEGDMEEDIDPRLQDVVERMFQRCADDQEYEQAIGIALESRRLDVLKSMIAKGSPHKLLPYVLEVCMTLVQNLEFRNKVCLATKQHM